MPYPDEIDEFREIENLPGLTYDAEDKKTLFVEDLIALQTGLINVENFVGLSDNIVESPLYLLIANLLYPVGKIVEFSTTYDPNDSLGFGTWVLHGEGMVTVGQDGATFDTLGDEIGSETVALTEANLAAHTHSVDNTMSFTIVDGASQLDPAAIRTGANSNRYNTSPQNMGATSGSAGSGTEHNNIQPSKVVVRWVRTA